MLQEKEQLQEKMNDLDARINDWLELSEKTFNFACYARYWFAKGDNKTKTQLLFKLGSNLLIKDGVLTLDERKEYIRIKEGKEKIQQYIEKFEPGFNLADIAQSKYADAIRPIWLGD
ncbi:hypothetical protein AUJ38_00665 [bacterium CG1_02_42_9]|nr:MAG: hypothetical protein AUJ38_00665 [bacterium CG1_02_42_9]